MTADKQELLRWLRVVSLADIPAKSRRGAGIEAYFVETITRIHHRDDGGETGAARAMGITEDLANELIRSYVRQDPRLEHCEKARVSKLVLRQRLP